MRRGYTFAGAIVGLAVTATARAEQPTTELRYDTTAIAIGTGLVGAPYLTGVAYAATRDDSPRGMEKDLLYVPVLGPVLAVRGVGCDDAAGRACDTGQGRLVWVTLLADTIVQTIGAIVLTVELMGPDEVPVQDARPVIRLTPTMSRDCTGVSASATF